MSESVDVNKSYLAVWRDERGSADYSSCSLLSEYADIFAVSKDVDGDLYFQLKDLNASIMGVIEGYFGENPDLSQYLLTVTNGDATFVVKRLVASVKLAFFRVLKENVFNNSKDLNVIKEEMRPEKLGRIISQTLNVIRRGVEDSVTLFISDIKNDLEKRELRKMAAFDEKTGALMINTFYRFFSNILGKMKRRYEENKDRFAEKACFVIFDLDHFRRVNNTYGHLVGDEVLAQAVSRINSVKRPGEELARFGGEEFVMFLPGVSLGGGATAANRFLTAINSRPFRTTKGAIDVTATFGVAEFDSRYFEMFPELSDLMKKIMELGDACLYVGKGNGPDYSGVVGDRRNSVVGGAFYDDNKKVVPGVVISSMKARKMYEEELRNGAGNGVARKTGGNGDGIVREANEIWGLLCGTDGLPSQVGRGIPVTTLSHAERLEASMPSGEQLQSLFRRKPF